MLFSSWVNYKHNINENSFYGICTLFFHPGNELERNINEMITFTVFVWFFILVKNGIQSINENSFCYNLYYFYRIKKWKHNINEHSFCYKLYYFYSVKKWKHNINENSFWCKLSVFPEKGKIMFNRDNFYRWKEKK